MKKKIRGILALLALLAVGDAALFTTAKAGRKQEAYSKAAVSRGERILRGQQDNGCCEASEPPQNPQLCRPLPGIEQLLEAARR